MLSKNKEAIICPNCGKLINADVSLCPYCSHRRSGVPWKRRTGDRSFLGSSQLVRYIIYINVAMYVLSLLFSPRRIGMSANPFTALSPGITSLRLLGASGTIPIDHYHRWGSLVTANYLHASLLHIFFNMMALRQLGPFVIREFGSYRFIAIYALGGIIGFFISYLAGVSLTIGASASVCALIGAILYYSKSRGGAYGEHLYRQVSGWIFGLIIFGLLIPGINNWGHGGGLLGGVLLGYLLGYGARRPQTLLHRVLAYVLVLLTGTLLIYNVFSALL
jgi:rhomboid protease GluP